MARINIEDSLFKDHRFLKLLTTLGCEYKAIGMVTTAWIIAQENWLKYKHIPAKAWPKDLNILIEVELAERTLTGDVYVKGSKSAFAWLEQKSSAGKKLSEKKREQLTKARDKKTKNIERTLNGSERNMNGSEALTLTPTLSLTLTHDPTQFCKDSQNSSNSAPDKVKPLIARYCEVWKSRYGGSAPIGGKAAGQLKSLVKDFGLEKSIAYVDAYLEMPDQWFITRRHDIATLLNNLNAVAQFMETGRLVTKRELAQIDQTISTQNLIEEIRRNGI